MGGTEHRSARGFLSFAHPASDQSPDFSPPFAACGRAMRLDRRTVDQNLGRWSTRLCKGLKQSRPHALFRPSDQAIVKRLPRSIFRRRVDPSTARLQYLNNAADHAAIINPRLAPRVGRQMRLDLRKLFVRQPKLIPIHRRFLSEAVNHKPLTMPTILWVLTLDVFA